MAMPLIINLDSVFIISMAINASHHQLGFHHLKDNASPSKVYGVQLPSKNPPVQISRNLFFKKISK
jgi:hypothetical protein